MPNSTHAIDLLRNKEYEKAYAKYKIILESPEKDDFRYRNINNILICIYFIYIKKKESSWFEKFDFYLKEYIKTARESDTITWANNILEDLLQYALEVAFVFFTENKSFVFSEQKEQINNWFDNFIIPFINELIIAEKRDSRIFYDVILRMIFKERANFERCGHEYQNVVNTKILCNFFLKLTKDNKKSFCRSRSNIYQLFSELIYNDPEASNQEYSFLTREAVNHLDMSLDEFPTNQFAKKRKEQLIDSLTIQEQLHRFDHDVSSKISTLKSLIRKLKNKDKELKEPERMEVIINDINVILNLSRDEIPEPEDVDILAIFKEIQQQDKNTIEIEIQAKGEKKNWAYSNKGYLKVIFENIIKNTREAYKRNSIQMPEPAILIKVDSIGDKITLQDWAGGIPEDLLRNDKLFEPYVSEKGIAQGHGLGLSLVLKACKTLSLDIKYKVKNNSTIVTIQKQKE